MGSFVRYLVLTVYALSVLGCETTTPVDQVAGLPAVAVELQATPFYPQQKYQCGPAALAAVLNATGLELTPDQLVSEVYLPARKGSLPLEMIAATRQHGRLPYLLEADIHSLLNMLQQQKPVLVFLNLGTKAVPVYHYAVLIGYLPDKDKMVLRSGEDFRRLMSRKHFLASWQRANNWAMAILAPGEFPAAIDIDSYLQSVILLESIHQYEAAGEFYAGAVERFPGNVLARFGLANTLRSRGLLDAAAREYRQVLVIDPHHKPAFNNLVDTLVRSGRCDEAHQLNWPKPGVEREPSAIDAALAQTRQQLEQACPMNR